LLVTSAHPKEGKTSVSLNLAITLAQKGCRVLISMLTFADRA